MALDTNSPKPDPSPDTGERRQAEDGWGRWGAGSGWRAPRNRPLWWPENEPWPPRREWRTGAPWGEGDWRRMRRRGLLIALPFLVVFLLAVTGAIAFLGVLVSGIVTGFGPEHGWPLGFFARGFGGAFVLLEVLALGVVLRTFRNSLRPINDLMDAVARVERGDFTARVRVRGPRDLRRLLTSFNGMAEHLQNSEETRRNLLADVSHELRTPLTVVQGNLEGLLDGIYPRDDAHLMPILEETRVMARLIEDLRTLSLAESGALKLERESTDLSTLAKDTARSFQAAADAQGVKLAVDATDAIVCDIDPLRIRAVLNNLIGNALRYTQSGGTITIHTSRDARGACVGVRDTGKGIAPEALPHIFDRFYKGRDSLGTGLGLAIAKQLVQAHGGAIHAQSTLGDGTRMWFTLPA